MAFMLSQKDPVVPTVVGLELNISSAQAGYSLKRMYEGGILDRHRSGKYMFYSVNRQFLRTAHEFFTWSTLLNGEN